MKGILEFDLNEHDDVEAHKRAVKALDILLALWDIDQHLRSQIKYAPDNMSDEVYETLESTRNTVHQILNKYNISFDELMS